MLSIVNYIVLDFCAISNNSIAIKNHSTVADEQESCYLCKYNGSQCTHTNEVVN